MRWPFLLLVIFSALISLPGCGGRGGSGVLPVTGEDRAYLMDNGLAVNIEPRPGAQVVALHLRLSAGTAHEEADEGGAAHAVRQLVAGPDSMLAREVQALGGRLSVSGDVASTSIELIVAKDDLESALALLALVAEAPSADLRAVARGLDRVQSQLRLDGRRRLLEALTADAFFAHPNGRPALPEAAALQSLQEPGLRAFHERRYRPEGAHLVIVGDVEPDLGRQAISRALAGWTGVASPLPPLFLPPAGPRVEVRPGALSAVYFAYVLPELPAAEAARLDLLALVLSDSEGRLARAAQSRGVELLSLRAFAYLPPGPGLFVVGIEVPPQALEAGFELISAVTRGLTDRPPSGVEIARARARLELEATRSGDTVEGRAAWLAALAARWPEGQAGAIRDQVLATATGEELARLAAALLKPEALVAHLGATKEALGKADPALWSEALTQKQREAPILPPDGLLEVAVRAIPGAATVTVRAEVPAGRRREPVDMPGISLLVAERLATAGVQAEVSRDGLALSVSVPKRELDDALMLLRDRFGEVSFSPSEVEAARARAIASRQRRDLEPAWRVRELFTAHVAGALPEPDLTRVTPGSARAFHDAYVARGPLLVVVTGDVAEASVEARVRAALGGRAPAPAGPKAVAQPAPPLRLALDEGEVVQSVIGVRLPGLDEAGAAAALVAAEALSDSLNVALAPLTEIYGPDLAATPWLVSEGREAQISVAVRVPAVGREAAERAVTATFDRLAAVPLSGEQVSALAHRVLVRAEIERQRSAALARWVAAQRRAGRLFGGLQGERAWRAAVMSVTPADLQRFATDRLSADARLTVEVGPTPEEPQASSRRTSSATSALGL